MVRSDGLRKASVAAIEDIAGDPALGCPEIWCPERDTSRQMYMFHPLLLPDALDFAERIKNNQTFTHFHHTSPEKMLNRSWECYLLYEGDMVIGWAQIQRFLDNPNKKHVCRIGFALLEEWSGQGLGSFMVDYVMKAIESKFSKIVASVFADNTAMLSIYLKRGFVVEGFFENEEIWDGKGRNILSLAYHRR
jgi:RimJ/RimL family protein N-acetyltransferase